MKILLTDEIADRLVNALRRVGRYETGGILMGERLSDDLFGIKDITIQHQQGNTTVFTRMVRDFLGPLRRFFLTTGRNFERYNYLGEWHSHPSFSLEPSSHDHEAMCAIVDDPCVGANFAVLVIVRLRKSTRACLEHSATVYLPGRRMYRAEVVRRKDML